ncbi:DUF983 domain-containing protein [uncultured Cyclobacterium sp.]|uniref:DUF983 domain-containing protein n=1 Tax=uncultured Cyclobacterium sp. TaxID=453820 RepID=UPI0030EBB213|tara:strand:- start:49566 stop:49949 length:384 start_codon:yes stop_codon:yes gene_type:complete
MNEKNSLAGAILKAQCPKCRKGNIFPVSIISFRKLTQVNQCCPNCGVELVPEPDFYYGAMYISYALSVALFINVMIILNYVFDDPELVVYIVSVVFFNIVLLPVMLRYSKVLYLYGLGKISYDPKQK